MVGDPGISQDSTEQPPVSVETHQEHQQQQQHDQEPKHQQDDGMPGQQPLHIERKYDFVFCLHIMVDKQFTYLTASLVCLNVSDGR